MGCFAAAVFTLRVLFPTAAQASTNHTWTGSSAAGFTLTQGNSKTALANLNVQAVDKWSRNELMLGGSLTYGESAGVKSTEAADAKSQYNRLLAECFYGGMKLDVFHNGIADLKYRITLAPVAGYYLLKNTNSLINVEAGPAYIYTDQGHGINETKTGYPSLRLGQRLEQRLSHAAKLWETLEYLPRLEVFGNYLVNFEVGVDAVVTRQISLRTTLQDYYNSHQSVGRFNNDVRLIAGVAYKF
jgi:hypothetical protein